MKQCLSWATLFLWRQSSHNQADIGPDGENVELLRVDHTTFFEVEEKGVKATAAAGLAPIDVNASQTMLLDRTFIFVLRIRSTDQVLFMSKVENPNLKIWRTW